MTGNIKPDITSKLNDLEKFSAKELLMILMQFLNIKIPIPK